MDKLYSDLTIQAITVSLATRETVISVGQKIPSININVVRIERDDANFEFFGVLRYNVYAKGIDGKEFLWKSISEGSNPIITYDSRD